MAAATALDIGAPNHGPANGTTLVVHRVRPYPANPGIHAFVVDRLTGGVDSCSVDAAQAPGAARPRRVIAVGASAGGVEALRRLVSTLPADLDAALCVVLHIPPTGRSLLAPILDRQGALHAVLAEDGMPLRRGMIFVAPADHHLLVRADRVQLSRGPKENGVRPAADPLFRSLARSWGPHGIAVVLSGALGDGTSGAVAVAQAGGSTVVQDPQDAVVPGMPQSALSAIQPDAVVALDHMAGTLRRLVDAPISPPGEEEPVTAEPDPAEQMLGPTRPSGHPSGFTCPECSGALWELRDGELVRYRCRVGHAYSEEAMIDAQGSAVEAALWAALEVLEERGELLRRIADRMHGNPKSESRFRQGAREADERAAAIRRVLATSHRVEFDRDEEAAAG
jgi:two-component system chemotaxis response regulator CheB